MTDDRNERNEVVLHEARAAKRRANTLNINTKADQHD